MKLKLAPVLLLAITVIATGCGNHQPKKEAGKEESKQIVTVSKAKPNPFLAGETYAITHFDPGQSDAFPYPVSEGTYNIDLSKYPRIANGPIGYIQLASTDPNYMWVTSTGGFSYVDVRDGGFKQVAQIATPDAKVMTKELLDKGLNQKITSVAQAENIVFKEWGLDWSRIINNCYMFVDKDNILYSNANRSKVYAYQLADANDPSKGIKIARTLDFSETLKKVSQHSNNPSVKVYGVQIAGLSMTYDGKLIILSMRSISVVNRDFSGNIETIEFAPDEFVSNSVCVDENNGIYVATDKAMHKIVWTGTKLSTDEKDGAWSSAYDFGDQEPPSVKLGTGTGSTPTLMGFGSDEDKLVVITDGSNQMKLVAFWRDAIPADAKQQPGTKSPRIAGQIAITCGLNPLPKFIQSEQSVVVKGYGAFVVNNIREQGHKDKMVDVLCGGPVFAPPIGAERCEWDPKTNQWKSVWTRNDVVGTSMVPSMSSVSNIAFINGYTPKDGWEITGMDWNTGKTVTRIIFGQDNHGNGAYATIQFLPNSDLMFNSIGGVTRVPLKK